MSLEGYNMAYYTALIAKWVTLTPGTTQQKIDQINAITITGSIPTSITVNGVQLANCVNYAEFKALTAAQQQNLMLLLAAGATGGLLGGSANTALLTVGMILDFFPVAGPTVANLTALAKGLIQPWWQAPVANGGGGLNGPVSVSDTTAAGLS
jgi:hypothetical protein